MPGGGLMRPRLAPQARAQTCVRVLQTPPPDAHSLKKGLQQTRTLLRLEASRQPQRLPERLPDPALVALYETIWPARPLPQVVRLKRLLVTGIRHAALVRLRLTDGDLTAGQLRLTPGQGPKARYGLLPTSGRGELAPYVERPPRAGARHLFASNRCQASSTRRVRQIVKQYARAAGLAQRV